MNSCALEKEAAAVIEKSQSTSFCLESVMAAIGTGKAVGNPSHGVIDQRALKNRGREQG